MHTIKLRATLSAIALTVMCLAAVQPAFAGPGGDVTPPVIDDGADLIGSVGNQINTLKSGSAGGSASAPPPCDWTDASADPAEEREDGELRWRLTAVDQEDWEEWNGWDTDQGTTYRYECWHKEMCGDGEDDCFGVLLTGGPTWCGNTAICYFDAINPSNLALYLVDGFVENLAAPSPQFSPDGGMTYVNFDTWMWLDNVPAGGQVGPLTMEVPGITVTTTASLDSVLWDMGEGQGTVPCPLTTTEASAAAECTYNYDRSSATQPDATYTGTASTVWLAEWVAEEFGLTGEVQAPRSTDFSLQVAEIQTVVTLNE